MYLSEFEVLGVPISIWVLALPNTPSLSGTYTRCKVLHTCMVLFVKVYIFPLQGTYLTYTHTGTYRQQNPKIPRRRVLQSVIHYLLIFSRRITFQFLSGYLVLALPYHLPCNVMYLKVQIFISKSNQHLQNYKYVVARFHGQSCRIHRSFKNGTMIFLFNCSISISPNAGANFLRYIN